MSNPVKPIPEGYHSITPYLIANGASKAVEFYKAAFGASEIMRLAQPDGKVGHAELRIGDSVFMLADEFPEMDFLGPKPGGSSAVTIHLYVEDADAVVARALAAGATLQRPIEDKFYGDRSGTLIDPFGHIWHISTHVEDVPPDEISRRAAALFGGGAATG